MELSLRPGYCHPFSSGRVTELGVKMGAFPLSPSLSRVLLYAAEHGMAGPVLSIVSMLR